MDTLIFAVGCIVGVMVIFGLFMNMSLQFQAEKSETDTPDGLRDPLQKMD